MCKFKPASATFADHSQPDSHRPAHPHTIGDTSTPETILRIFSSIHSAGRSSVLSRGISAQLLVTTPTRCGGAGPDFLHARGWGYHAWVGMGRAITLRFFANTACCDRATRALFPLARIVYMEIFVPDSFQCTMAFATGSGSCFWA